jgi:small-conductance mechanosensitive channel/CRP-like cAMP-binding protein
MTLGLALLAVMLVLRGASRNRHLRGRLSASAAAAATYAIVAATIDYGAMRPGMLDELRILQPLLLAFAIINALVALLINPWRVDRIPDRFPTILQDTIVIVLFALAATLLLQDRIFAATAAGAVVIGLALQDTLGNLFAGLAIQIEKPFNVGHWVRVADIDGVVSEITWRATKIRTKNGNFVVVPNSKLSADIIINYSEPTLDTRVEVDVGVAYDAPPTRVKRVILDAVRDEPLISRSQPPEVLIVDFAGSSIIYRLRVWCEEFLDTDERLQDRIRTAIYYAFRRENIEIPYPIQIEYSREEAPPSTGLGTRAQAILADVAIFSSLSAGERQQLAQAAREVTFGASEIVVRQGDAGQSMFVVVSGEARVTVDSAENEVARIGAGGFFGEMSLLTGAPRNATVRAIVDSQLVEITVDAFKRFVMANPLALEQVGAAVAKRRAELEEHRSMGPAAAAEPAGTLMSRIRRFLGLADSRV